ncbi:hypothetical protein V8G54_022325 [Vigna mungo]|uniref:Transcription initiation factor TFIID subunit 10 n=1 Tax=Vigna mungo TaxID=3915 RepID=A0AAQ3RV33_VIGMU
MNQNPQSSDGRGDDDTALSDFLASLMDYTPTIPDELVEHYLAKSGFQCPDVRLWLLILEFLRTRLVAVATQKFVAEVAGDALQLYNERTNVNQKLNIKAVGKLLAPWDSHFWHCKARQATIPKDKRDKQQKDKRLVLTMEDLSKALREYGVNLRHQEYFADSPSTGMDPATREE